MDAPRPAMSFIVRLDPVVQGETDRLSGVVERVRTGEKHRFQGAPALARLIARLAAVDRAAGAQRGERVTLGGDSP